MTGQYQLKTGDANFAELIYIDVSGELPKAGEIHD